MVRDSEGLDCVLVLNGGKRGLRAGLYHLGCKFNPNCRVLTEFME